MISLDQVSLLEKKVESAVAKIQQLKAENDALRNKCNELTNALSEKSEQLSTFETDQSQIEEGIKKALDRLNSIENTVLKAEAIKNSGSQAASTPHTPVQNISNTQSVQPAQIIEPKTEESESNYFEEIPSFDTMNPIQTEDYPQEEDTFPDESDSQDGLGFDIF